MSLDSGLAESLARVRSLLHDAEQPWWIIGSVAVALHGGEPGQIRDIDVLLGPEDAHRYFARLKLRNVAGSGDSLFRSELLGRWTQPAVEVELMAGLKVKSASGWEPVLIHSREELVDGLYAPSRDELRSILFSFGRAKDLQRAATLA